MADKPPTSTKERIAKVIARAGLASRREAEAWIEAGRVSVNGEKITSPALNVSTRDRIMVDGAPLPERERTRLFLYHKPRGLVTTNADPEGRPTIFAMLPKNLPRLISVGRLDLNTEGLLLLTNDGGLARVLELPETGWLRRYRVRARGDVTQAQLDALRDGITIEGIHYGEIEATRDSSKGENVWLTFAIREGKNREVRNVLEHLGLQVNRLIRVSFGPFQLGELGDGEVEEVRSRVLREQLGEKVIERARADFSGPIHNATLPPEGEGGSARRETKRADGRGERPRVERSATAQVERSATARPASPITRPRVRGRGDERGVRGRNDRDKPRDDKRLRDDRGRGKRPDHKRRDDKRRNDKPAYEPPQRPAQAADRKGRTVPIVRVGTPDPEGKRKRFGRRPYHGKRKR